MLVSPLKPTDANTLRWTPEIPQEKVHAFFERVMYSTGFIHGLHPVVNDEIRQKPADLILFFGQLHSFGSGMNDGDQRRGELYLLSDKPRKPCTDAMVAHIQFTSGVWAPECPRVEGRVEYTGQSIDYRDMTFIFSNFGEHFDTCLNDWVETHELEHVPPELKAKRFRSREFLLQVLAKCVNAQRFPAKLSGHDLPETRAAEFEALMRDCNALGFPFVFDPRRLPAQSSGHAQLEALQKDCNGFGFPLVLDPAQDDPAKDQELIRRFNQLLMDKACAATSDREVKRFGQLFRMNNEVYFSLARTTLNPSIQALGYLITIALDPEFASLFRAMVKYNVRIGEAASYVRDGKLMPDFNWGGDMGYQFAPHQHYLVNGQAPTYYDAMRQGFMMAASMLVVENDYPFEGFMDHRAEMGVPDTLCEAILNLFASVLLPPQ